MAALRRESRLMPTVKCSTCGLQVEISLMGDHICTGGSGSPALECTMTSPSLAGNASLLTLYLATPPLPAASLFGRLMPSFGNPLAQKQQPRVPPQVDTSAASMTYILSHPRAHADHILDRAFISQGQLTPISMSSGSQSSISPQTPIGRPDASKTDEFFSPQIANNSPPPPQPRTPGGYGGLDEKTGYEEPSAYQTSPPKKQPPNLAERMNNMNNMSGPFGRRPSAAGPGNTNDRRPSATDRPGTSASNVSNGFGSGRAQKPQRLNGYGGFGAPGKESDSGFEPPVTPNRAETFPRPNDRFAPPTRTSTAPPGSATLRPDRLRPPTNSPGQPEERIPMTSERNRRPSRGGPDTSRPPPPRSGGVRPTTPGVPTINLAEEFGIGNPYHAPSESTSSSSNSENGGGSQPQRRPSQASQASQASSRTSPPRSLASRSGRNPSDPTDFDSLMSDIQASMKPDPTTIPLKLPLRDMRDLPSPLSASRGYDPRIDPAILNPRAAARGRLPSATPDPAPQQQQQPKPQPQEGLTVQIIPDALVPGSPGQLSPRWTSSPARIEEPPKQQQSPSAAQKQQQSPPRPPTRSRSHSQSRPLNPTPAPSQQQPPSARGNCKSCHLPIKGKSISSADGRLTGRYHKPCFVCTTCREPFTSSTFYVLDDRPYCELHYHALNDSLCGSCGRGIEGQYLEDEGRVKHHVGCFKCGECGMALRDGYFEVGGKAFCEKDAWRLAGGGPGPGMGGGGLRPMMGLPGGPRMGGGGYNPSRLGPGAMGRPRMEKRMTRLGMM
ncbi:hypothetical protein C8A05DRAFT_46248 [Staphylotrichum tortipilum]|uniref:LIM zinc-binding domain-containing protein n=1 Tax=Staphylotrichum tortipilum TaxID=2831512 RepID=A0AAN6RRS7_9PEZI|nr:hypothetical protein C8A05DRAFT_46248 [Staphylotrichum longicolle]